MDANGNEIANEGTDFASATIELPITAPLSPIFLDLPQSQVLPTGTTQATFRVRVSSAEDVTGMVLPPDYDATELTSDFGEFALTEVEKDVYEGGYADFRECGVYAVGFTASNADTEILSEGITVTVLTSHWDVNADGAVDISDLVLIGRDFGASPPSDPRTDVNGDGVVDIGDLVLIGRCFGETCGNGSQASPALVAAPPDAMLWLEVNALADGLTQVRVKMSSAVEVHGFQFDARFDPRAMEALDAAEGPYLGASKESGVSSAECEKDQVFSAFRIPHFALLSSYWQSPTLDNATGTIHGIAGVRLGVERIPQKSSNVLAVMTFRRRAGGTGDLTLQRVRLADADGRPITAQFRSTDIDFQLPPVPEHSGLLPNYPNPFNPETWIPFQLAEPANVTLRIFSLRGELVRTLNLGWRGAGVYSEPENAVHWDGCNQSGESMASGVYWYQIQAGEFTATRRMLLLR